MRYRVFYWMIDSENTEYGPASDLIHSDYDEAQRELEMLQDTEPHKEFQIERVLKNEATKT